MKKTTKKLLKRYALILLYILLINILLTFSTVSLHELGHLVFGVFYGCKDIKMILFDLDIMSTYTEMSCDQNVSVKMVALGPLILVTPFSMIFFLLKEKPEKFYELSVVGSPYQQLKMGF